MQLASETSYTSQGLNVALEPLEGCWLSSVTAAHRPVGPRFSVGASVYNLFDTVDMHPVGAEFVQSAIAQDGRTAAVRTTIRF